MIIFNVVKETHGWAVRLDDRMSTPFWSRDLAIQEAYGLAETIRRHGAGVSVKIEGCAPNDARHLERAARGSDRRVQ
jgi:hypothetical protein